MTSLSFWVADSNASTTGRIASWLRSGLLVAVLLAAGSGSAGAQSSSAPAFSYRDTPLRTVLHDVQRDMGYRVLYRDALVAGVSVTLKADTATVLSALRDAVSDDGIRVEVDRARRQVLLAPTATRPARVVTGYVVDASDGERLPRATVIWRGPDGRRRGAVANDEGRVRLRLPATLPERVRMVASHVGYAPASVVVDRQRPPTEVSFRLRPRSAPGPGVTVRTAAFPTALDTTWQGLARPDLFTPLGEAGVLRSLQALPSVAVTSALSGGMHVRGSQADGVHVQIDGMPIYNQTHLFGLFDAFNDDALRTVGFFADVAPARYRAPPGGTLAFQTRGGNRTELGGRVELSSTALSATADGPLANGRGGWLLAARRSYLDVVGWLNNDALVAQGVGTTPRTGPVPEGAIFPGRRGTDPSATFYDVHGTARYEWPAGHQLTVSGYVGGDDTEAQIQPFRRTFGNGPQREPPLQGGGQSVGTQWGNEAASLQLDAALTPTLAAHTTVAVSRYHAQYRRSALPDLSGGGLPEMVPGAGPVQVQNELVDGSLTQRVEGALGAGAWTAGAMGRRLAVRYDGEGGGDFVQRRTAVQGDLFGQYDTPLLAGRADVHLGLRLHGFSTGPYGRLSPRLRIEGWPKRPVSVAAGYTRNHQFLHRLSATGDTRADTWVMSAADRPPASADHVTFEVEAQPAPNWHLRASGYVKDQRHVRLNPPLFADEAPVLPARPWALGHVRGGGLELLHRLDGAGWRWTASYTLSRTDLRFERAPSAPWRPAPWDRRHQGVTRVQVQAGPHWSAHLTWLAAAGAPNALDGALPDEPARLAPYHRLDAALQYQRTVADVSVEARVAVFNVYDRDNPRYRQLVGVPEQAAPITRPRLRFTGVDVYDLGLQPSVRLAVSW